MKKYILLLSYDEKYILARGTLYNFPQIYQTVHQPLFRHICKTKNSNELLYQGAAVMYK